MITNDVLRRLRFAVGMSDNGMLEMIASAGTPIEREALAAYFLKEEEPGYAECPSEVLEALLDGMILKFRGPKKDAPHGRARPERTQERLDNNGILKKIRIALELQEEDMIAIMELSGIRISSNELSAFFRRRGQKNYRECLDQFLRNFLSGLAKYRKDP